MHSDRGTLKYSGLGILIILCSVSLIKSKNPSLPYVCCVGKSQYMLVSFSKLYLLNFVPAKKICTEVEDETDTHS